MCWLLLQSNRGSLTFEADGFLDFLALQCESAQTRSTPTQARRSRPREAGPLSVRPTARVKLAPSHSTRSNLNCKCGSPGSPGSTAVPTPTFSSNHSKLQRGAAEQASESRRFFNRLKWLVSTMHRAQSERHKRHRACLRSSRLFGWAVGFARTPRRIGNRQNCLRSADGADRTSLAGGRSPDCDYVRPQAVFSSQIGRGPPPWALRRAQQVTLAPQSCRWQCSFQMRPCLTQPHTLRGRQGDAGGQFRL